MRWLSRSYLALVYLLLYAPVVVLVVFSFNDSRTGYNWGGLSLRWYESLFNNHAMVKAMWNSLWLALTAATVSTVISEDIGYATPVLSARDLLGKDVAGDRASYPTPEDMVNAEFQADIGDDALQVYAKYWEKLKSGI